tara:strand:+ start:2430 stop:3701 length:1272 start_codon:yes stop_codon:yes gene_type:complete
MIDYNTILERNDIYNSIVEQLNNFEENKHNILQKRGFYIYGESGIGKTYFIEKLLKENDYNIINYDASDIRNKSIIDSITRDNMNDRSIIDMFQKKKTKIAIVMDEIDGMNSGDKGGINTLIKLIRPKKTKKQKEEITTNIPIICISNGKLDKKMKELMKVCYVFNFKAPNYNQINNIINKLWNNLTKNDVDDIYNYVKHDLRKINDLHYIFKTEDSFDKDLFNNFFSIKCHFEDAKEKVKTILNEKHYIEDHNYNINETDRTIIALILHENIIDINSKVPFLEFVEFYNTILNNFCYGDYIDRITFQKQIWQFNEMSSLIKTYYNQYILHDKFKHKNLYNLNEVRFTKVLTKYSTEYNNMNFIQMLCEKLNFDKKDMILFFNKNKDNLLDEEYQKLLEDKFEIQKLDLQRMHKFITNSIDEE